ncbi:MAG: riboflavin biosynthesis protein RibF [Bacilli bacterium]
MEIIYINSIEDVKNYGELSIAHGFFDGVHKAHQRLISRAKSFADKYSILTGVVTFDKKYVYEHNKESFLKSLTISTLERRIELFEFFNIDIVFVINFDIFRSMSAQDYITKIISPIGTKNFVMGKDNFFGKDAIGNYQNIFEYANNDFEVDVVELVLENNVKISSSEIKNQIMNNNIENSNALLGYYYQIHGTVISGKQLGRTIGYPTTNLKVHDMVILPQVSAYATIVSIDNIFYESMTNIGYNPTTDFREDLSVETYIFDFDKEIYGKNVKLYFIAKIRDEEKFSNLNSLLKQLGRDEIKVREILDNIDLNMII